MDKFLYIFILVCVILICSCYDTYIYNYYSYTEAFNSKKQSFILLGDSILKNDAYVTDGESVEDLLQYRTNGKSLCLAVDNSVITDVYSQIYNIPDGFDNSSTTIFLSVGGNDILNYYVYQENSSSDTSILGPMFSSYKKLVNVIQTKLPNANIVLLDIYYPENFKYRPYHTIISQWNKLIYNYAIKQKYSMLKISKFLTKSDDFSFGIEPSAIGSRKIVDTILSNY
jgi:hypothetical protein